MPVVLDRILTRGRKEGTEVKHLAQTHHPICTQPTSPFSIPSSFDVRFMVYIQTLHSVHVIYGPPLSLPLSLSLSLCQLLTYSAAF
jgi:hypothetical protein